MRAVAATVPKIRQGAVTIIAVTGNENLMSI